MNMSNAFFGYCLNDFGFEAECFFVLAGLSARWLTTIF